MKNLTRVTFNPTVMGGKPCIRGLRVTVGTLVGLMATGHTKAEILKLYPYLEAADIDEALAYAAWRAEEVELPFQPGMRLLLDMNLSPEWVPVLTAAGHDVIHWSTVGNIRAEDPVIMAWARQAGRVVFTHDLDFGTTLALTQEAGPSVIQVRTQDVTPAAIGGMVIDALQRFRGELEKGAIVVLDEVRQRVRILPLK